MPMKKLVLVLVGLLLGGSVYAEPRNITTVSAQQIVEIESMHQTAADLLLKNDFRGALHVYSDILLAEPDDETAYTGLGQIYITLGQLQEAHEAFKNALNINSNNEVALLGIQQIMDLNDMEGVTLGVEKGLKPVLPPTKKINPLKKSAAKELRLGLLNAQRIQMSLRNAGVYAGSVNGLMGHQTQQAIKKFQKMRGFEETGRINNITWQALLSYL